MPAAVRTTAPTGSSETGAAAGSAGSTRGSTGGRVRARAFGLAAPAALRPGFALVLAAFGERAGFAAGLPSVSAFDAALAAVFAGRPAADSRFELRFPGRELGRFPSTPPSSVMDGDSSSARSGYTGRVGAVDKVGEVSTG
jgi:hypothetical protein